jgi:hypothetical protein
MLLNEAIEILNVHYGCLRKEENWLKLFQRLVEKSGYSQREPKDVLKDVFGNELVNGTILMFQFLCPVRLAFLDGQARMAAVHYFIRKIVPTIDGNSLAMSSVYGNNTSVLQHWSLGSTGAMESLTECFLYMPRRERWGRPVSNSEIWERREISKQCFDRLVERRDHLNEMSPARFSDVLLRVAGAMAAHEEKYNGGPPYVLGELLKKVKNVIKYIFMWLVEHEYETFVALVGNIKRKRNEGEEALQYGEMLYKRMFGEDNAKIWRIFPSLQERKQAGMPNLHALILCLAAASTERKSLMYFGDCVEKDWIVQIREGRPPAGDEEELELHPGTFIGHGNKKAWYEAKLYAVRWNELEKCQQHWLSGRRKSHSMASL